MRISTKVEYGIAALVDIGAHAGSTELVNVSNISKRQGIPQKYLEQVLSPLRQAKLIIGVKGARGGYVLGRAPSEISVSDILSILDSTLITKHNDETTPCENNMRCAIDEKVWTPLEECIENVVNSVTLSDLIQKYKANISSGSNMFYI